MGLMGRGVSSRVYLGQATSTLQAVSDYMRAYPKSRKLIVRAGAVVAGRSYAALSAPRRAEHLICDINDKAQLDILEVPSNLYKATYRMRFCYLRAQMIARWRVKKLQRLDCSRDGVARGL
jgi:hypothetical protein